MRTHTMNNFEEKNVIKAKTSEKILLTKYYIKIIDMISTVLLFTFVTTTF